MTSSASVLQDGFYDGRSLEGRFGLIPSNFIEPIINPTDLPETVRHIVQKLTGKIFSGMIQDNLRGAMHSKRCFSLS